MKQSRFIAPLAVAVVFGVGVSPSSSASSHAEWPELTLEVAGRGECQTVAGADGEDDFCASGGATVVALRDEPRGTACPNGGRAISWGSDKNENHVLEPSELEGSTYVCRHAAGRSRFARALVAKTPLAARSGHCPAGGTLVQSGLDRDGDGVLSASEIDRATFACNRFGGTALQAFVDVVDEPAGKACAHGGKRIGVGHEGEAARISYACDAI